MANTYTSINHHYIFSTKNRVPSIVGNFRERLHAFMGGVARENRMTARYIGGVADHVHLLVSMPTTLSIARSIQLIKGRSSIWIHESFPEMQNFAWQEGYAAFSVSASLREKVRRYIDSQEVHHATVSFTDELKLLLKKHEIEYNPKYLE